LRQIMPTSPFRWYWAAPAAAVLCLFTTAAQAGPLTVIVTGSNGKPLASAIVAVVVKGTRAAAAPGTMVQIAQRERQFQPQLIVFQTGTAVQFPNFDTVRHHVYSFSPIQKFELKLYAGTPAAPVVFDKPGIATLGCNIHDRMSAWVVVVDTPYFAKTDAAGVAQIELPPGEHRLRAWHPGLTEFGTWVEQAVHVGSGAERATIAVPVESGV
jgi:plastocyanin